jgi:hypothetical protein
MPQAGISPLLDFRGGGAVMTIRGLARDYYRALKAVETLEKERLESPAGSPGRAQLELELRRARAERDRLKAMLDGAKESD